MARIGWPVTVQTHRERRSQCRDPDPQGGRSIQTRSAGPASWLIQRLRAGAGGLQRGDPADIKYCYSQFRKVLEKAGPPGYWTNLIPEGESRTLTPLNAYTLAVGYARLGDKPQALACLKDAFAKHDSMENLLMDEVWDDYRNEPRFKDILKNVGLAPWQR